MPFSYTNLRTLTTSVMGSNLTDFCQEQILCHTLAKVLGDAELSETGFCGGHQLTSKELTTYCQFIVSG